MRVQETRSFGSDDVVCATQTQESVSEHRESLEVSSYGVVVEVAS